MVVAPVVVSPDIDSNKASVIDNAAGEMKNGKDAKVPLGSSFGLSMTQEPSVSLWL